MATTFIRLNLTDRQINKAWVSTGISAVVAIVGLIAIFTIKHGTIPGIVISSLGGLALISSVIILAKFKNEYKKITTQIVNEMRYDSSQNWLYFPMKDNYLVLTPKTCTRSKIDAGQFQELISGLNAGFYNGEWVLFFYNDNEKDIQNLQVAYRANSSEIQTMAFSYPSFKKIAQKLKLDSFEKFV